MPPLGHAALHTTFSAFHEGSAQDLAHRVNAALALHRITANKVFLEDATRSASRLASLQAVETDGRLSAVFWEGPEGDLLGSTLRGFGYFGNGPIVLSFCEMIAAAPQHPDAPRWRDAVRAIAGRYCEIAARNPWGLVATHFELKDPPAAANSQPSPLRLGSIRPRASGGTAKSLAYTYQRFLYHYDIMLAGLFLNLAAEITGDQTCRTVAQR